MLVNLFQAKLNPSLIVESSDLHMYSCVESDGLSVGATPHNVVNTDSEVQHLQEKKGMCIVCVEYPLLYPQNPQTLD